MPIREYLVVFAGDISNVPEAKKNTIIYVQNSAYM